MSVSNLMKSFDYRGDTLTTFENIENYMQKSCLKINQFQI